MDATTTLEHKNIVKYLEFKEEATLTKKNGETKRVAFIVQELVEGGELFDYVVEKGTLSEEEVCNVDYFQ